MAEQKICESLELAWNEDEVNLLMSESYGKACTFSLHIGFTGNQVIL